MEVPSTTSWFSEALCTSIYKDSQSPSPNSNCMTALDEEAGYITSNYTDLSDACRNSMSQEGNKKYNDNSENVSNNNNSDSGDSANNNNNNDNNNYLILQAKQRLGHSSIRNNGQEEYIDLDKLYLSQRSAINPSSMPPSSSSSSINLPSATPLQPNYQNFNEHHNHLTTLHHHSLNHLQLGSQSNCHSVIMKRRNHPHPVIAHSHHSSHHSLTVPPQGGHSPSGGATQSHHQSHHHPSVSSSTSPNTSLSPSHLQSDHNHQRHQLMPPHSSLAVSQSSMDSHHPYNSYTSPVFNGEISTISSQGRDSYLQPNTGNESKDYGSYNQQQYSSYNEDPDSDSESEHQRDSEMLPVKKRPGRPRGSRRKKPEKLGRLWEFIRDLLLNSETCPSLICWDNYDEGMFRFVHSDKVAKLWGAKRDNPDMNYEKLSRAMRYYYKSKVLQPVFGRRLVYKFGPEAKGWRTENPNFRC